MRFGAHVSIAGGLANAPPRGRRIGCDAIQIFVKNQLQWRAAPLRDSEVRAWKTALAESRLAPVVVHSSYLINLAATDPALRRRSRATLRDELERCERLGIAYLNFHPGAHLGRGVAAGLRSASAALDSICRATPGYRARLLIEATAGQGSVLGARFEELHDLLHGSSFPERLGVCLDTCHLLAAGYDLRGAAAVRATLDQFEHVVGLSWLHALHLNDSRGALGSHRDRHANIGRGQIGLAGFRALVREPRLMALPGLLETPGGDDAYRRDLRTLRRLAGRRPPAAPRDRVGVPAAGRRRRAARLGANKAGRRRGAVSNRRGRRAARRRGLPLAARK